MRRLLGTVTEGGQRKTTLRALSISGRAILEEQEGRRAIRIDASFCLNYYRSLPPFSLSLYLHPLFTLLLTPFFFFLPPLLPFSQTSLFEILHDLP